MPDEDTPDSAVYLPGRNLLLLAKSSVWCALNDFAVVALGTLNGNPFADSGAEFFDGLASLASVALDRPLTVETPFARFTKVEVLERGRDLALELTFSCIAPAEVNTAGAATSAPSGAGPLPRRDWPIGRPTQDR